MGNDVVSLKISPTTIYTGPLLQGLPHGHGSMLVSDSGQNWMINGQFDNG